MEHAYLIRYGLMRRVGRFSSAVAGLARGQRVVVRSGRGTELGEVLLEAPRPDDSPPAAANAQVLRAAEPDDFERASRAEQRRPELFALCQQVFLDGVWPIELIDVEPLLDDARTVLHYLGPHRLDIAGVRAIFRNDCGLDVVLEPVGRDAPDWPEDAAEAASEAHGCGHCGSAAGGCGSGGCSTAHGGERGGCADCGVQKLLAQSRFAARP